MGVQYQIAAQVAGGNQVAGLRKEVSLLKGETAALPKTFKSAASSAKEFAAILGVGFGAQQLAQLGKQSIELGGHIKDLSSKTGLSTTAVQKLGYAARLTGADMDSVGTSVNKLNVTLGKALSGNSAAIQAFEQLKLNPADLAKMNNDQRLYAVIDAISEINDSALKAKLGLDVMGKGMAGLLPIMSKGADNARVLGDELERMGGVITPEQIELLDQMDDTIARIGITSKTKAAVAIAFLAENSETLQIVAESLAIVYGSRLAVALGLATRAYALNTIAAIANARAQELAALQATGNVRAILAMNSASGMLTRGLGSLVAFMGGPLNVAIMAAGAAWFYTGTQLQENITRAAALRAVLITLRGEFEKGAYIRDSQGFMGFGRKSPEEIRAGVGKIQEGIDNELLNLRTPDSETASGKMKAQMAEAQAAAKQSMEETMAQIKLAQTKADARADEKTAGESAIKAREKELRQLDDFILKQQQANAELQHANEYIGMSTIEIQKLEAARKLDDEAARATIRMQPDVKAKYLATTEAIKQQRLEIMQKNYQESRTFSAGTKQALAEYVENAGNAAESAKQFWSNSFNSMEDALVNFAKTGKLSFRDLANSIIDDLIRIQVRSAFTSWLSPLLSSLAPGAGAAASVGGATVNPANGPGFILKANGGIVSGAGDMPLRKYAKGGIARTPQMAVFGEGDMAEAYVPLPDGRAIPVTMSGSGGGQIIVNTTVNVNSDGSSNSSSNSAGDSSAQAKALARRMEGIAKAAIVTELRPGGLLAKQ